MTACNGYDFGIGVISEGNKALGIEKRPISIGWICRKAHVLSPLAAEFVENLKTFSVDT